jgi:colanic acid/amylovoran biosynthesis protein
MKKRILLIGQLTLQLGRIEHGNIGNFYIIEPLIKNLHKTFPSADIYTTFQMTKEFCKKEKIICLPMEFYYDWSPNSLDTAYKELAIASIYNESHQLIDTTPFINEVLKSDLVIDFSGDIWGKNADLIGENRFLIGLIKDRIVQLLNKKNVMLVGSPGPFDKNDAFAKVVYSNFDLVTNREPISTKLLKKWGFDISKTLSLSGPAFLFKAAPKIKYQKIDKNKFNNTQPKIGFTICGWNFTRGPYSIENRKEKEFLPFVKTIEYISQNTNSYIYLISHSNGFDIFKNKIQLKYGRDYPIIKKLYEIVKKRNIAKNIFLVEGIYNPADTKAIISKFDMMVSGRVHGCIAALSQYIPAVLIDYGHEPKAHKIKGFAKLIGVEKYIANPSNENDLIFKCKKCWKNRNLIKKHLKRRIPQIKKMFRFNFKILKKI